MAESTHRLEAARDDLQTQVMHLQQQIDETKTDKDDLEARLQQEVSAREFLALELHNAEGESIYLIISSEIKL